MLAFLLTPLLILVIGSKETLAGLFLGNLGVCFFLATFSICLSGQLQNVHLSIENGKYPGEMKGSYIYKITSIGISFVSLGRNFAVPYCITLMKLLAVYCLLLTLLIK